MLLGRVQDLDPANLLVQRTMNLSDALVRCIQETELDRVHAELLG